MSPEIIKQDGYNPLKADIWAMGVCLFFIMNGSRPFYGKDKIELKEKILEGNYI